MILLKQKKSGFRHPFWKWVYSALCVLSIIAAVGVSIRAIAVSVRVDRGLAVRQTHGDVQLLRSNGANSAIVGNRLSAVGDGLRTGRRSSAVLEVDTDVGFLDVSERTEFRIRALSMAADGGRITHLSVLRGQVRTRLRRFTNQGSEFEIETPAGISGVRGTEFGVSVQEDGKTGIATLTGAVETTAAGESVAVPAEFQNLMLPGEPPTQPVPLRDDPGLEFERRVFVEDNTRFVTLIGQVDPVNTVFVDGDPQTVDRLGEFRFTRLATARLRVEVVVITPLGRQEIHEIYLL
ncbi:FecR domain-containing protein [Nodosilinea sp. LEGE 07088]|nr:FecR domain-containing protein [Nodosilinea sp. LEGE 07088]